MTNPPKAQRVLLVTGSPRSGTTVLGAYIGTNPQVLDLGEYYALFHTLREMPHEWRRMPTPARDKYLASAQQHARDFALQAAQEAGYSWVLDSTPWNQLVLHAVQRLVPSNGLTVMLLRSWPAVVQSLAHSYAAGYTWAGRDVADRVSLWCQFYEVALLESKWVTLAVNFDQLRSAPERVLGSLRRALATQGLPDAYSEDAFEVTHAPSPTARPQALRRGGRWCPQPVLDPTGQALAASLPRELWHRANSLQESLHARFPNAYMADGTHLSHAAGSVLE